MTYGCHNRPQFRRVLPVQDGYFMHGVTRTPRMVAVPFRMAHACQYTKTTLGQSDGRCTGCKHRESKFPGQQPTKNAPP